MSRPHRLLAVVAVVALGAALATPAPTAADWKFFGTFSPLGWIRALWAEEGSTITPWGAPHAETGSGIDPLGVPRQVWAEEGSAISPLGRPAAVLSDEGSGITPWGLR